MQRLGGRYTGAAALILVLCAVGFGAAGRVGHPAPRRLIDASQTSQGSDVPGPLQSRVLTQSAEKAPGVLPASPRSTAPPIKHPLTGKGSTSPVVPPRPKADSVAPTTTRRTFPQWIVQNNGLTQMLAIASMRGALAQGRIFNISGESSPRQGPNILGTQKFASYADFATAVSRGQIASSTRAVLYDPEAWSATPLLEQAQWAHYGAQFVDLAHRHGWIAIVAPGLDLVRVLDPLGKGVFAGRYLLVGVATSAARTGADIVVVQAQSLENDPIAYGRFLVSAASQVREVNPSTQVFGGLSTGPTGIQANSGMLVAAVQAIGRSVDGYWVNTPGGASTTCPGCTGGAVSIAEAAMAYVTSLVG